MSTLASRAPVFMLALFGTAATGVASVVSAIGRWVRRRPPYDLSGGAIYLVVVGLTMVYDVPRNNSLAAVDPNDPGAAALGPATSATGLWGNDVWVLAAPAAAIVSTLSLWAGA